MILQRRLLVFLLDRDFESCVVVRHAYYDKVGLLGEVRTIGGVDTMARLPEGGEAY